MESSSEDRKVKGQKKGSQKYGFEERGISVAEQRLTVLGLRNRMKQPRCLLF